MSSSSNQRHTFWEHIKRGFLGIFKVVPESVIVFFSGILVSFAINILTGPLTDASGNLQWNKVFSMASMLVSALLLIVWACVVKPYQDAFSKDSEPNQKAWDGWINRLADKSGDIKLTVVFLLFILTVALTVVFWVVL